YTSGVRASYVSPEVTANELPDWLRFLRPLSGDSETWSFLENVLAIEETAGDRIRYQWGISATQLMYTPEDRLAPTAPSGERPYAGWLGVGLSIHAKTENVLNSVEITFGVVGPNSKAKESQDFVHDLRGIPRFEGWDSQIPEEPTFNLHITRRYREPFFQDMEIFPESSVDGFLEIGADLGNYRTAAYLGGILRFGYNLPVDFSDPRLSLTANTQTIRSNTRDDSGPISLYGILGGRGSLVAHDITLDGPVFRDFDTGTSSRIGVAEGYVGFGIRLACVDLSYVYTYRTLEFEDQLDAQSFGSVVIKIDI
ncbi:MAG: lipid A deacylase LpxR family protein, partial [Verrucomicrobiota bacterium]